MFFLLEFVLLLFIICAALLFLAEIRKCSFKRPKQILSFTINANKKAVVDSVILYAFQKGLNIDGMDEENITIVLSQKPTKFTWGFFYPIYINNVGSDKVLVEVGIRSKLIQIGPIVTRNLDRCFCELKAFINLDSVR